MLRPCLSLGKILLTSTLTVMMLTKLERNQIYEAITQGGIDSAEFKFMVTEETVVSHENGSKLKIILG
jgi:hypothetical protein